jgi:hypothetical protein
MSLHGVMAGWRGQFCKARAGSVARGASAPHELSALVNSL